MPQGTRANLTGNALERVIRQTLDWKGYTFVDRKKFDTARFLDQSVYTTQYQVCKGIYETPIKCDFILYDPEKHPNCLVIESKWQESGGSVDEKFPYLVMNIRERYPFAAIVVLDGGGFKKGAEAWLRKQVGKQLICVFNMMQFQKWANSDEL